MDNVNSRIDKIVEAEIEKEKECIMAYLERLASKQSNSNRSKALIQAKVKIENDLHREAKVVDEDSGSKKR